MVGVTVDEKPKPASEMKANDLLLLLLLLLRPLKGAADRGKDDITVMVSSVDSSL